MKKTDRMRRWRGRETRRLLEDSPSRFQTLFNSAWPCRNSQTFPKDTLSLSHTNRHAPWPWLGYLIGFPSASLKIFRLLLWRVWQTEWETWLSWWVFLNVGPVYCVSQAVIFTATGRMGGSLLTENILQTKPNRKREPRAKESQRKKTNCFVQNVRADNLTTDVGTVPHHLDLDFILAARCG